MIWGVKTTPIFGNTQMNVMIWFCALTVVDSLQDDSSCVIIDGELGDLTTCVDVLNPIPNSGKKTYFWSGYQNCFNNNTPNKKTAFNFRARLAI